MSNLNDDPLIRINWRKVKRILRKPPKVATEITKKILILIIKGLTGIVKRLTEIYSVRGVWIALLITIVGLVVFAALNRTKMDIERTREELRIEKGRQEQVEEELQDKIKELEERIKETNEKVTTYNARQTQTTVAQSERGGDIEQWRHLVANYFPETEVDFALAIMDCESGGNLTKINWEDAKITGFPSCGLFQINGPMNWAWDEPEVNVAAAYDKWLRRGWEPWLNCRNQLI